MILMTTEAAGLGKQDVDENSIDRVKLWLKASF
jgi:hypothetical protein